MHTSIELVYQYLEYMKWCVMTCIGMVVVSPSMRYPTCSLYHRSISLKHARKGVEDVGVK
jgi:hypothetical protein